MSSAPKGHIVLYAYEAWGHNRALCNLAARLVQNLPVYITYFTTLGFYDRIKSELQRGFGPDATHLLSLIRVVALPHEGLNPIDITVMDPAFAAAYEKLVNGEPVSCLSTGSSYDAIPSPDVALLDLPASGPREAVRRLSKKPVKVFIWLTGSVCTLPGFMSPQMNLRPRAEIEAARTGRSVGECAEEMLDNFQGVVIEIPGLPPMYDYEMKPQETQKTTKGVEGSVVMSLHENLVACDGILIASVECVEKFATDALRGMFAATSRSVYVLGPLVPSGDRADVYEKQQSAKSADISDFLEATYKSHGAASLLYFSLGSWFWPTEPEKVWAFLDVLIELKIPFIVSHGSPLAVVPDAVSKKIKSSGLGLLSPWSPQQMILSHPVAGWIVTHGGNNSVMEALTHGVPMICWPFAADQPVSAAHLSVILDVAYELFEVRSGPGLRPVHRLGRAPEGTVAAVRREARVVLGKAFGEDGQRKRANAQKIKAEVALAWTATGPATRELEAFLDSVVVG